MDFDEMMGLSESDEKTKKLINWYKDEIQTKNWLNSGQKNSIIKFKDKIEYKKNGKLHRLNGPAIEYIQDATKSKYYYKGMHYEDKNEWLKVTVKELRKLKLKQIDIK